MWDPQYAGVAAHANNAAAAAAALPAPAAPSGSSAVPHAPSLSIPILGLLPGSTTATTVQPTSGIPLGYQHHPGLPAPQQPAPACPQQHAASAPPTGPAPSATLALPPPGVGGMQVPGAGAPNYVVDPSYYSSIYNSYAKPNAQLAGPSSRVPIPQENTAVDEDPVYVNAKQYAAILRRRQQRAKAEEQNKMLTARRPYLHKSRHNHAVRRPRGPGGRFLTSAELEEWRQKHNISEASKSDSEENAG
mmetsp:Transcript_4451/g.11092  ORF Transcript_4451/g.11092 Transcript_4451/m.11092 type:complete len:247 (-) Transcript_4451:152-892(-)|eukprot:jgi/Tetstr1/440882/TSEL_029154.t1